MNTTRSKYLWARARRVFPGGVNSPVRAFQSVGGEPIFIESGSGAYVRDADGNRYLDFLSSWGPLILGHAPKSVVKATRRAARAGSTFGATTRREVELAEFILERIPFIDKIRFVNSGTEAVMTALRLARAATKRNKIVKFEGCYHGHSDALLAKAGSGLLTLSGNIAEASSPGVTDDIVQNTLVLPLDDENAITTVFEKHGKDIAAVIIEPVPANAGLLLQRRDFLQHLLHVAHAHGSLVIFDEVISGFRLGFSGYTGRENLAPDIITYGKIIGGGLPVGAIAGKNTTMDLLAPQGPVYQAGTLSGNPLAMASGLAVLRELADDAYAVYSHLKKSAARLKENFERQIKPLFADSTWRIDLVQDESLFWFSFQKAGAVKAIRNVQAIENFSAKLYAHIFHAMLAKSIYLAPSAYEVGFLSAAMHKRDIDYFTDSLCEIIRAMPRNAHEV